MGHMRRCTTLGWWFGFCAALTACGGGSFASSSNDGGNAGGADTSTGGVSSGGAPSTGGTGNTGTGGGIVTGTPIPLDQYPAALAQALCPPLSTCCSTVGIALTVDKCSTTLLGLSGNYASANPQNYTYDPAAAGTCIANAPDAIGGATCTMNQTSSADPLCGDVFIGKLAPGAPCTNKIECAHETSDTVSCSQLSTGAGGAGTVCIIERKVTVGQPCYWTCTQEPGGLRTCSGSGSENTPLQGRCFTNDGLYCGANGQCVAQGKLGASCTGSNSCAQGFCEWTTHVCTAPALQGGACDTDQGCAEGLYCSAKICTPKLAPGAPCQLSSQCLNGTCKTGACVASTTTNPSQLGMALLCAVLAGNLK